MVFQAGLALAFAEALLRLPKAGSRLRWALSTLAGSACCALAFDLALDWAIYSERYPRVWTTSLGERLTVMAEWIGTSLLIAIPVVGCLALARALTRAGCSPEEAGPSDASPEDDSSRARTGPDA